MPIGFSKVVGLHAEVGLAFGIRAGRSWQSPAQAACGGDGDYIVSSETICKRRSMPPNTASRTPDSRRAGTRPLPALPAVGAVEPDQPGHRRPVRRALRPGGHRMAGAGRARPLPGPVGDRSGRAHGDGQGRGQPRGDARLLGQRPAEAPHCTATTAAARCWSCRRRATRVYDEVAPLALDYERRLLRRACADERDALDRLLDADWTTGSCERELADART